MKKRTLVPIAAIVFAIASLATAIAFLATHQWFGAGDLRSFSIWSAILAMPVAFIAVFYGRLVVRMNQYIAYALALVIGVILGYVVTLVVWRMLGPWFGAFSFPVFYCWLAGAISACVTATKFARKRGPNQSSEPTAMSVTPPAAQEPRQP